MDSLRGVVGQGLAFAPRALPGDSTKPLPGDGDPWVETCCGECGGLAEPHGPHAPRDPLLPERAGFLRTAAGRRPVEALYFVHFLSVWGWRGWEFLVVLFLVALTPDSLLTTALFSLLESATVFLGAPFLGAYIDRVPRGQALARLLLVQQGLMAASSAVIFAALVPLRASAAGRLASVGVVYVTASASSLSYVGTKILIERDWIVRLCARTPPRAGERRPLLEDSEERGGSQALANANGVLKVIDMGALICSPIAFGAVATCASLAAAVAAMGAFAVLACAAELPVVAHLAAGSPALEAMGSRRASVDEPRGQAAAPGLASPSAMAAAYAAEPAARPALSLAVLYMTVLSFGNIMTGYLKAEGALDAEVAAFRGSGAVTGLLAAVLYSGLHRCLSLRASGMLGVWFQLANVVGAAVACHPDVPLPPRARFACLVVFVCCSRFGLWTFDMSVTQMIQESVAADRIGRFNTAQESLQKAFEVVIYLLAMGFHKPRDFWVLALVSAAGVLAAAANFTLRPMAEKATDKAGPEGSSAPL